MVRSDFWTSKMATGGHLKKKHLQKRWASDLNNVQTDCWPNTTWYKFTFSQYIYRQVCWERGNIHCAHHSSLDCSCNIYIYYHDYCTIIATMTTLPLQQWQHNCINDNTAKCIRTILQQDIVINDNTAKSIWTIGFFCNCHMKSLNYTLKCSGIFSYLFKHKNDLNTKLYHNKNVCH